MEDIPNQEIEYIPREKSPFERYLPSFLKVTNQPPVSHTTDSNAKNEPPLLPPYQPCTDFPHEIEHRLITISGLSPNTSEDVIKAAVEKYGDIDKINFSNLSKGIVEVSFYDLRDAINMRRKMPGTVINRSAVFVKFSPFPLVVYSDHPPNEGTIVVFHLPPNISENSIYLNFISFGDIKQIRQTPKRPDQRFIEFFDIRAAEQARAEMNQHILDGHKLIVDYSLPGGFRKAIRKCDETSSSRNSKIQSRSHQTNNSIQSKKRNPKLSISFRKNIAC